MSWIKLAVAAATLALVSGSASAFPGDHAPKVDTSRPTPVVYPVSAQSSGEEGTVVLKVYVLESGRPTRIGIGQSSGFQDLDTAAVQTAANWHYVPAVVDGSTADDWAQVRIDYRMPHQTASK
jgi:TonB family protein